MSKYRKKILQAVLLPSLVVFLSSLFGCSTEKQSSDAAASIVEQVKPVKVFTLQQEDDYRIRKFPGIAQAYQDVNLSFRVSGPLVALNAETGLFVKKGDVIARIDPRDFNIRIATMEAHLASSQAEYTEAKLQFGRYQNLVAENAAAKATYDRIKSAYQKAEATTESNVRNLENARNALKDTVLYAPFSGFIQQQYVENHEVVQAGQSIVSMVDLSITEVKIAIPEDLLPTVDDFESYVCRFQAIPETAFSARFKEIAKKPNPSNRTYDLTLSIEEEGNTQIRPGMAAEVAITIKKENGKPVFVVPMSAVATDMDRNAFVWLVDANAGRLKRQAVKIGLPRTDGFVEISGSLKPGQLIASAGAHTLLEEQKIRVLAPPSETNVGAEM